MADFTLCLCASMPYVVMTLIYLSLSLFLTLLQSLLADSGISSIVIVVYELLISVALLAVIAIVFERGKRPAFTTHILLWAFFIGLLQITLGDVLLLSSLRYVTAAFQSVGLNLVPVVVFVLAVFTGRESFRFGSLNGQAKLLGVAASTTGGVVSVLCSDHGFPDHAGLAATAGGKVLGCLMIGLGVLATAVSMLLVERLATKYQADLTLSATMTLFGTLQTVSVAAFLERNPSSWRINWSNRLQLLAIFYGGIVVTGLSYVGRIWCVHKKGPVFTTAFAPLLVVFSFLLQTLVLGDAVQISSIIGAFLVIGGLYLLLWAKSRDYETERTKKAGLRNSSERIDSEPLLDNTI